MSEHVTDQSVFGDEDNNPFPHSNGIASIIQKTPSDKARRGSGESSNFQASTLNNAVFGSLPSNSNERISTHDTHSVNDDEQQDSESMLLFQNEREQFNTVHHDYESRVIKLLSPNYRPHIEIVDAGKSNEGMAHALKKYVVYTIKLVSEELPKEEIQTRRRYSDFESLRDALTRIFPLVVIPPIPPKNYFSLNMLNGIVGSNISSGASSANGGSSSITGDGTPSHNPGSTSYSYINSKHLNKVQLIDHRKRLLANFLNLCLKIPQVRDLEFFAKFLDPSANWSDEIVLIDSQLPKSVYQLNPENGLKTDSVYANLPLPNSNHPLGLPFLSKRKIAEKTTKILSSAKAAEATSTDQQNNDANKSQMTNGVAVTESEASIKASSLDDINKRIVENLIGMSGDYVELGTALNSFSLNLADSAKVKGARTSEGDDSKLDIVLDKVGIAFDRSHSTHQSLIAELETKFSEPLGEAVQYSNIFASVKRFHDRKQKQRSLVEGDIRDKKKELVELRKAGMQSDQDLDAPNAANSKNGTTESTATPSDVDKTHASKLNMFMRMSSIKKFTKYVSDIMDQNPEQTRKQRIGILQTKLETLEKCQTIILGDIAYITDELGKTSKSFQQQQLQSIFRILLNYNSIFIGWARKNIEIWEEIKEEIESLVL